MNKLEKEIFENNKLAKIETEENNNKILQAPIFLNQEEKEIYESIVKTLKESIKYRLTQTDTELVWQYCQTKIMRDRAWREYNKNPDRYIRIVTGICNDGKTPKVIVKENEHYKTLIDCNKQLEIIFNMKFVDMVGLEIIMIL